MTLAERLSAERLSGVLVSGPDSRGDSRCESPSRTLITDEPWDCYHLESLLPLKETYRENTEFGFLLRHYWIPATVLTLRQSSRLTLPDGRMEWTELEIERKMARCRCNECLWRERVWRVSGPNGSTPDSNRPAPLSEKLCSYDCYEQTYASDKPVLFKPPGAAEKTEARRAALYRLPMLVPPGPVPIGFCWCAKVGDDYMTYRLEAEDRLGETSVVVIRRDGRCSISVGQDVVDSDRGHDATIAVVQRKGITLLAWNRGAVLEDRFVDEIVQSTHCAAFGVGTTTQAVARLVRSRPENTARASLSVGGRELGQQHLLSW